MNYVSENEMITRYAKELKINVLEDELEDVIGETNPWGAVFTEKYLLLPISQHKLSKNTLLEQNPGYK